MAKAVLSRPAFQALLIIVLGLLAYGNTFSAPFTFDDGVFIKDNAAIRDLGNFIGSPDPAAIRAYGRLFSTRYLGFLSFALNYRFHGLELTGYHAVNLAIHLICALSLYALIFITFATPVLRDSLLRADARLIALFAALMFVAHPVNTQAVTYLSQRFASLAAMWCLLSMVAYACGRILAQKQPSGALSIACLILSALLAAAAMKTKEISFTLPIAIALYEFSFFTGGLRKRALYLLPMFLTMLIIPLSLMGGFHSQGGLVENLGSASRVEGTTISRWHYLLTQFTVIVTYIRLIFFPINQNIDYDYPVYATLLSARVGLSLLLLLALVLLAAVLYLKSARAEKTLRLIGFGAFWFFLALSVESSIIPIHNLIFEHRLYLPLAGALTAIVTGIFLFACDRPRIRPYTIAALAVLAIALGAAAHARNSVWRSEITLWEDAARKSPLKARTHDELGVVYATNGMLPQAVEQFRAAIEIDPSRARTHVNLGATYYAMGHTDEAIKEFQLVVNAKPETYEAHYNLGLAFERKGLHEKSRYHLNEAARIRKGY